MRSLIWRACVLTVLSYVASSVGSVARGDFFDPPPLPTSEPSNQPTPGSLPSDARAMGDCNCGQPECVECCAPCCTNCCDDPCAKWTVSAGALFLERSDPGDSLLFYNPSVADETMNASDFDFGWQPGYEVGLTRHRLFWDTDLEARFWAVDSWTDTIGASFSGSTTAIGTTPGTQVPGPRDVTSTYGSEILSLELNLKRRCEYIPRWKWIAGFRMLELDENLDSLLSSSEDLGSGMWKVNTRNRLYGFQVGGELDIISNCNWCVRGFLKAGVYGNEANNRSEFDCLANPDCEPFFGDTSKSQTSFVGETGISVRYCLNCRGACGEKGQSLHKGGGNVFLQNWAIRADYRFIWLDGMALASDQFAATQQLDVPQFPPNGQQVFTGASTDGNVFYHGLFVGLEWRY